MQRPQWIFKHGQPAYPYRWRTGLQQVQLIYRTLDVDPEDYDNYIKMDNEPLELPAYRESLTATRWRERHIALQQAQRVAGRWKHADEYLRLKAMRKRLRWASNDLEFVFEPYLRQLGFKTIEMARLAQRAKEEAEAAEPEVVEAPPPPPPPERRSTARYQHPLPPPLTPEQREAERQAALREHQRELADQIKAGALARHGNIMPRDYAKIDTHGCLDGQYGWVIMRMLDCSDVHCGRCGVEVGRLRRQ